MARPAKEAAKAVRAVIGRRNGSERRRFFRIDDRLRLALRRIDAGGSTHAFDTEALVDIDRRLGEIVAAARVQAPAVAELAELLSGKIDLVIAASGCADGSAVRDAFVEYEVDISACGLGLATRERFEADEQLLVELLLPPGPTRLRVPSRVVRCADTPDGERRLQIDFTGIDPRDQELLVQFILRRQGMYLQRLREQREASPPRPVCTGVATGRA